jgi:hypothetical protein
LTKQNQVQQEQVQQNQVQQDQAQQAQLVNLDFEISSESSSTSSSSSSEQLGFLVNREKSAVTPKNDYENDYVFGVVN